MKALKEKIAEAGRSDNFLCALCEELMDGCECDEHIKAMSGICCSESLADMLCDAIDREYVERPRFEDGEPLVKGDEYIGFKDKAFKLVTCDIDLDGNCTLYGNAGLRIEDNFLLHGYRVKRPEVLDADGKPIKVGDTVYDLQCNDGNWARPFTVTAVERGLVHAKAEDGVSIHNYPGNDLTHEEPDTLERIEEDAKKHYIDYWGCNRIDCNSCNARIDGKTPAVHYGVRGCVYAMVSDLLARQRKVLEREAQR